FPTAPPSREAGAIRNSRTPTPARQQAVRRRGRPWCSAEPHPETGVCPEEVPKLLCARRMEGGRPLRGDRMIRPGNSACVQANVRHASTEDLLDRVTVWRQGMVPSVVEMIEEELRRRGVTPEAQEAHAQERGREVIPGPGGLPLRCEKCDRAAVV